MNKFLALTLIILTFSCTDKKKETEIQKEATELKNTIVDVTSLNKKERMNLVSAGNKIPNGNLKTLNESIVDIESFKGKLLIIDFWATWCAPCLKEAPIFKTLAKKYKNSNAEFISISVDQDFSDWKNHIQENNWKGGNYWFGMHENEPLFSLLYSKHIVGNNEVILMTLPKYVIVSSEGKILNNSDLRPSKPEFEIEIKKYLK